LCKMIDRDNDSDSDNDEWGWIGLPPKIGGRSLSSKIPL